MVSRLQEKQSSILTETLLETLGTPPDASNVRIEVGLYVSKVMYEVPWAEGVLQEPTETPAQKKAREQELAKAKAKAKADAEESQADPKPAAKRSTKK